ncbi:MAG: hypothetical protein QOD34_1840, partial [Mycobacterium sp.]|nr:hypothetical protein [Mycobacterium sp.]
AHELGVPLVSDAKFIDYVGATVGGPSADEVVGAAHAGEQFALF